MPRPHKLFKYFIFIFIFWMFLPFTTSLFVQFRLWLEELELYLLRLFYGLRE